jgi:hypothetical protein
MEPDAEETVTALEADVVARPEIGDRLGAALMGEIVDHACVS